MQQTAIQQALSIPADTPEAHFTPHSEYGVIDEDDMASLYNNNLLDPGAETHTDPYIPPTSLDLYRLASKLHATGYTVSLIGEYRSHHNTPAEHDTETLLFFSVYLYDDIDYVLVSQLLTWAITADSFLTSPPDRISPDSYGYRLSWKDTVRHEFRTHTTAHNSPPAHP